MNIADKYLRDITVAQFSPVTLRNREIWLKTINERKQLEQWTKEDIDNYLFELVKTKKPSTVEAYKSQLISVFKWLKKNEVIDHLKVKAVECSLEREDILTYDEVLKMVDATNSPFYKALIMVLFESGARIQEILACKVSDVLDEGEGKPIRLFVHQTKKGRQKRQAVLIFSAQHVRNQIAYMDLSKDDCLFPSPKDHKIRIDSSGTLKMIKKIAEKANIKKPVFHHAFRHAQATNLLIQGYNEGLIKKGLGWKPSSRAIDRYSHLIDEDFINARLEHEGLTESNSNGTIETLKVKEVSPIQKLDNSAILRQVTVENEALKERLDKQTADMDDMKRKMDAFFKLMEAQKKDEQKTI